MIVPYDSPELAIANTHSNSATASPFVVAIKLSGIKALPGILNACVLIFVFSAANSGEFVRFPRLLWVWGDVPVGGIYPTNSNSRSLYCITNPLWIST